MVIILVLEVIEIPFGSLKVNAAAIVVPLDMSSAILLKVDQSGNGDFKKIQDAIDAVPSNNSELYFISVKPGTYREKIVVPADKPFITLSSSGTDQASNTILTWSDTGEIFDSATLTVLASDFVGRFLTIQETEPPSMDAGSSPIKILSWMMLGSIISAIVTLKEPLISCGNAASLYEKCHLHSVSKGNGSITAQHRISTSENTCFTFLGCKITGIGTAFLGRPWGAYSRVVFAMTYMSSVIVPQGWDDWQDQTKHSTVYYGEYKCYGPGADTSKRVQWSHNLSDDEAAPFLTKDMIGGRGWLRPTPTGFKRRSGTIATVVDENN
ncbi:hypothetical protein PTKIN_Ptkin10aG0145900 [Pterospermum kingtungense]